jgi:hypothetical protein
MRHWLQSMYGYWRMEHKRQIQSLGKKCPAPVRPAVKGKCQDDGQYLPRSHS